MTNGALRLSTIDRNPRLYEVVSQRLLTAIREAGLPPGAKIPSERDLGERFGVSRTVIREAVRHLAAKGILETKTGSSVCVADIGHDQISESIEIYLTQRGPIDPEKVHEVRQTLELRTAALAAERATGSELQAIRSTCERLNKLESRPEEASQADVAFHRAIAEASGNDLFLVLIDSLSDVLLNIRRATLRRPGRTIETLRQHRRIAEAIQTRSPDEAIAAMQDHLADSLDYLRATLNEATTSGPN